MRQTFQLILYVAVATVLTAGCTGKRSQTEGESARQPQPTDTLYTAETDRLPLGERARRLREEMMVQTHPANLYASVAQWWADFDSFPLGSVPRKDNKQV